MTLKENRNKKVPINEPPKGHITTWNQGNQDNWYLTPSVNTIPWSRNVSQLDSIEFYPYSLALSVDHSKQFSLQIFYQNLK